MTTKRFGEIIALAGELAPVGLKAATVAKRLGITGHSASRHLTNLVAKNLLEKRGNRWFRPQDAGEPIGPPFVPDTLSKIEACVIVLQEAKSAAEIEALREELRVLFDHYFYLMGWFEEGSGI